MDDLNSGLLQINLSPDIIDNLYTIIYGNVEKKDASVYGNYALLKNYKANYLLYNNSIGLFGIAVVSDKTTKVINYIDNLLKQLKSDPEFWSKLAVAIRKEKRIFTTKIIKGYTTTEDGDLITAITTKILPNQDYRVYDINATDSATGTTLFATQEVNNIRRGTRTGSLIYKTVLVGYLDPTSLGGIDAAIAYSDLIVDEEEGTVSEKISFKLISNKEKNKELLKRNGYYFKSDLKLLLKPDFLSKTFKGGLYMNVEKVGYKLMANFQDTI
ncbi:MAG: hypothetical protein V7L02_03035 [Nostoc sp.]|uniref:hypothetical protein n=1 Tax=Nostoc sp. TaxID=1180 RepID=UPI002FF5F9ED